MAHANSPTQRRLQLVMHAHVRVAYFSPEPITYSTKIGTDGVKWELFE